MLKGVMIDTYKIRINNKEIAMYNFDKFVERVGTESRKYDGHPFENVPEESYPLWIADMDFEAAPEIVLALHERMKHKVFGYFIEGERYYNAILHWHKTRYGVEDLRPEHICYQNGVLAGICHAVDMLTDEGDAIIIQTPAYVGFTNVLRNINRKIIQNPMKEKEGYYEIDFVQFEEAIIENQVKIFIHSNPHNPTGRVWSLEETEKLVDICMRHNVMILSDEIWSDMIINTELNHIPLVVAQPKAKEITISYYSPSKGFNLAGMWSAYSVCYQKELSEKLQKKSNYLHSNEGCVLAIETTIAAYQEGASWLDACIAYISSNMDYISEFLEERLPKIKFRKPDATYLLWLDFSELHISHEEVLERLYQKAGVLCNSGEDFLTGGSYHVRFNPATSRTVIEKAMKAMEEAFKDVAK